MVKTITIRDQVYAKLAALKRAGESFSELFERMLQDRNPLDTLSELRGAVTFKNRDELLSELHARRAALRP